MKKKSLIIVSGVILAAVLGLTAVPAAAEVITAVQTSPAALASHPGRAMARLLIIQDEAKVDAILAKGVTAGKITADQSAEIKAFWTEHHTGFLKARIASRLIMVQDGAKLKAALDKAVAGGRITADQEARIMDAWRAIHSR